MSDATPPVAAPEKYCCPVFEQYATSMLSLAGGGLMYPPEMRPDAQIQRDDADGTWNINGCCGGGCYVVTDISFCPFCGAALKSTPPGEHPG